jgi:hypothetical protein
VPTVEGAAVSFSTDAAAGETEVTVSDLDPLLTTLALVACLSFVRPEGAGKGTGKVKLKKLSVDGADVPLEEEAAGWSLPASSAYASGSAQLGAGMSIAFPGTVHMPDR